MSLNIFIADDDTGMRTVLRKIIESMDGLQCIGEAADGGQAVRSCLELRPDVVMLDIDMPVKSGVEAAKEIHEQMPDITIIFVTAHSQYALDAFELYAADYLIKPFKTDRVKQTLRRIQKSKLKKKLTPAKTLMLKNREGMVFLPIRDILMIYRENKITYIETKDETHTTSKSLNELWKQIESNDFFRCHRAYIIRHSVITKVFPYGRWTYIVSLKGTEKTALITHDKLEELQEFLK